MNQFLLKTWIIVIALIIIGGGIFAWQYFGALKELKKAEEKYLIYRNTEANISFQYSANLHLIQKRSHETLFNPNVCIEIPPGPEYAYYELCQTHVLEPFVSLISGDGETIIEISDLSSERSIDAPQALHHAFLKQYFPDIIFELKETLPIDIKKLPKNSRQEPTAFIYRNIRDHYPVVVFYPGRFLPMYAWVLILRDSRFQKDFNVILKSFNLNNTVKLVRINLANGNSVVINSSLYIDGIKFHDFYDKKWLLSDAEKITIFDERNDKFIEILKNSENKFSECLDFAFSRGESDILYCLHWSGLSQYNLHTKEWKIIYDKGLAIVPHKLHSVDKKNLIIKTTFVDAGCRWLGYYVFNPMEKKVRKGYSESECEGDEPLKERAIEASPNGVYVFLLVSQNNTSNLYLYNNLTGERSLLYQFSAPQKGIFAQMIGNNRFRFDDEKEFSEAKVYNIQTGQLEELSELTQKAIQPHRELNKYNENGFVYKGKGFYYYLDYMAGKVIPLYDISIGKLLFLTDLGAIGWK